MAEIKPGHIVPVRLDKLEGNDVLAGIEKFLAEQPVALWAQRDDGLPGDAIKPAAAGNIHIFFAQHTADMGGLVVVAEDPQIGHLPDAVPPTVHRHIDGISAGIEFPLV